MSGGYTPVNFDSGARTVERRTKSVPAEEPTEESLDEMEAEIVRAEMLEQASAPLMPSDIIATIEAALASLAWKFQLKDVTCRAQYTIDQAEMLQANVTLALVVFPLSKA